MDTNAQKKIKILRIIARLNIGGPAIHTILLTEGLNKGKFESLLVAGVVGEGEEDMMYLAENKKVKPVIIPELCRKLSLKNDLLAFWKLFQLTKKERPHIIHTHTAKAGTLGRLAGILYNVYIGFIGLFPLRLKDSTSSGNPRNKVILIHTFHGHVLHSYFGRLKSLVFIWIERLLAKFTDRIIVVGERIKEDLLDLKIGSQDKVVVIPLGLELESLMRVSPNKNSTLHVGIVGRLAPVKNHRMFLDIVKRLMNSNLELRAKFIIVGDGQLKPSLERYARQLGIEDGVSFTGWQKDIENLYASLDIIALTSLNEGTPVSLIEAMAAGKPVVATEVGGVPDLITNYQLPITNYQICERGILVSSGDIEGFAQGLSLLLNDGQLREKMGQLGREFVRNKFYKERLIKDTENLYQKMNFELHLMGKGH